MTVNHGGRLQPDYFRSYLSLVMNSRDCSLPGARDYMVKNFFRGNPEKYGTESYISFLSAVSSFDKENKSN